MSLTEKSSRFGRFLGLSALERRLFAEAWLYLAVDSIRLRLRPASAISSAIGLAGSCAARSTDAAANELALAVSRAAAHHALPMTCLPRSLALCRMLRRRGYAAQVRIGVRRENDRIAAHAWVEVDGAPLGEPAAIEERFLPFVARRSSVP
jgi:hypothetical protein